MDNQEADTGFVDLVEDLAFFARSSRYTMSRDSRSSMSITKPQNGCGISLYVRKSLKHL